MIQFPCSYFLSACQTWNDLSVLIKVDRLRKHQGQGWEHSKSRILSLYPRNSLICCFWNILEWIQKWLKVSYKEDERVKKYLRVHTEGGRFENDTNMISRCYNSTHSVQSELLLILRCTPKKKKTTRTEQLHDINILCLYRNN